jgi:hypothetical protein
MIDLRSDEAPASRLWGAWLGVLALAVGGSFGLMGGMLGLVLATKTSGFAARGSDLATLDGAVVIAGACAGVVAGIALGLVVLIGPTIRQLRHDLPRAFGVVCFALAAGAGTALSPISETPFGGVAAAVACAAAGGATWLARPRAVRA